MPDETPAVAETPKKYQGFALSLLEIHNQAHDEAMDAAWEKAIQESVDPRKLYRHKIITGQIEPLAHVTLQNILIDRFINGEPETLELSDIFRSHPEVTRAKEARATLLAKHRAAADQLDAFVERCRMELARIDMDPSLDNLGRYLKSMAVVDSLRDFKPALPEVPVPVAVIPAAPTKGKKKGVKGGGVAVPSGSPVPRASLSRSRASISPISAPALWSSLTAVQDGTLSRPARTCSGASQECPSLCASWRARLSAFLQSSSKRSNTASS